ncbi:MAG TPA: hypothetical protein PK369_08835 [Thermoclostridium sp.]|nr:hypothetical protein [Thermoclostridium sp.]
MAENRNILQDDAILNDDSFKAAYKAGLDQLKASDELIQTTLNKCRMELETTGKKRRPINISLTRIALRYAALVAACLLVLVLLLRTPMGQSPKLTADSAPARAQGAKPMADSGAAAAPGSSSSLIEYLEKSAEKPSDRNNAAEDDSIPDLVRVEGSFINTLTLGEAGLNSMDFSGIQTLAGEDLPSWAADAILDTYNIAMGTQYTCDESNAIIVTTLKTGGLGADAIREASGFDALLGNQQYYLLPLKDENGEYTILLPVVESAVSYDDTSAPLDIAISREGRTWLSSQYSGIYTDHSRAELLVDREGNMQLVRDTFNVKQITGYVVADINRGHDFVIVVKADGKEYAIPCFDIGFVTSVDNGKAYPVRDVLSSLADSLEVK